MKKILIFLLGVFMSIQANIIPEHYEETLKNGLKVVALPLNNKSNVIEVSIIYKVGSRDEVKGKSGIAHMLEHMNFKSTKNLKSGEFDEIVKRFGGTDNAFTSFDYTKYHIKTSNKNLEKSLELFAELMENLNLKDDEFQTERNVVMQERLWRTDNDPQGLLYFTFFNTAFQKHSYHWTPIGFTKDIKAWTLDDIKAFHAKYYQPQNALILVTGDVDEQKVMSLSKKYFEKIKNNTESIQTNTIKEPEQTKKRVVTLKKDSEVEYIIMGYKIPNFKHKDQVALNIIARLLSEGRSSRMHQILVEDKHLASSAWASNMELKDDGIFMFFASAMPHISSEKIEREIYKILDEIKEGKIGQEELERLKINTKADFIHSFESAGMSASIFADYLAKGDLEPLFSYQKDLNNINVETLAEVARRYFKDEALSIVNLKK